MRRRSGAFSGRQSYTSSALASPSLRCERAAAAGRFSVWSCSSARQSEPSADMYWRGSSRSHTGRRTVVRPEHPRAVASILPTKERTKLCSPWREPSYSALWSLLSGGSSSPSGGDNSGPSTRRSYNSMPNLDGQRQRPSIGRQRNTERSAGPPIQATLGSARS